MAEYESIHIAGAIVAAYVGKNEVQQRELPALIASVYQAVVICSEDDSGLGKAEPAVPVDKSITPDFIICLEDGKKLKMLKRYLRTHYDLSPDDYRRRWNLPHDYPMTAPGYAKMRSQLAKDIGLGTEKTSKPRKVTRKKASAKRK